VAVTVGNVHLEDQFEWDLMSYRHALDPEVIAKRSCSELGIGGEFVTAVAHTIREQVCWYAIDHLNSGAHVHEMFTVDWIPF
jgi:SWI/SNF-related matrix-associated actin-dependent regulator of chromatin subfamily B protein 1